MEQYGMTSEEYRGYTFKGTGKTILEAWEAKDKMMFILALPSMAKNAVKDIKDVVENGIHFDTSIGFAAGNDRRRQAQNAASDAVEEAAEKAIKKEVNEEIIGNLTKKIPKKYKKVFKCKEYANKMEDLMKKNGISGERIQVKSEAGIYSDKYGGVISTNGEHVAIKIGDKVYDNLTSEGMNYDDWSVDLGIKDIPWEFKITSKPIN